MVSHGGVGTTFLIEHLQKFRSTNCAYDRDGLKHLPYPPVWLESGKPVVYVYGDPVEAVLSLFRRDYALVQAGKNGMLFEGRSLGSLEDYVKHGKDSLGLTKHFLAWKGRKEEGGGGLLLGYADIWNRIEELRHLLDLPARFVEEFPAQRRRNSQKENLDPEVRARLEKIYESYYEQIV